MIRTNVKATPTEIAELRSLSARSQSSAMLASRFGPKAADDALHHASTRCHALALAHGLPEIPGRYGLDSDGTFIAEDNAADALAAKTTPEGT